LSVFTSVIPIPRRARPPVPTRPPPGGRSRECRLDLPPSCSLDESRRAFRALLRRDVFFRFALSASVSLRVTLALGFPPP
jgi:hypothetical protein